MKKVFTILAITTMLISCKKASNSSIKITSDAFDNTFSSGLTLYGFVDINLNTSVAIPDTITAIVQLSIPTASFTQIDTCIIPPNMLIYSTDANKPGIFADSDLQVQILSVSSKGNYNFSF